MRHVLAGCRIKSDVSFALDTSGSVGKDNFLKQIEFVYKIVNGLNLHVDSRVSAMTYATTPNMQFYLNEYTMKYAVLNALNFHYTGGGTNTASAIDKMRTDVFTSGRGDRSGVANIGVVITDGRSNDKAKTIQSAMNARKQGMELLTVGVGNNVDDNEMKAVANFPQDRNYFKTGSFNSLGGLANNLILAICNGTLDRCFLIATSLVPAIPQINSSK